MIKINIKIIIWVNFITVIKTIESKNSNQGVILRHRIGKLDWIDGVILYSVRNKKITKESKLRVGSMYNSMLSDLMR